MLFFNLIIKLFITNFLMFNMSHALNNVIDQTSDNNHLVIFNIDDSKKLEYTSSSYKQSFDQDSINYCNFDPLALTKKIELFDQIEREKPDFFVNVFSKTYSFNLTSEIKIRINFMNRQADSNQLWYLLVAKNSCTNSVVGSWRLVQSATTDTIYCYNRDDTVFGHRNKRQDHIFEQIWIPNNNEDVYFVVAVFTDETYSAINPTYFLLSSSVFRFERPDFDSPCPNLISQLNSLENSSNKTAQTKAKIETTISTSTTTPELPDSTKQLYQTSNTTASIPRSTYPTTSLALTIKAMNQKTELKNTFKKSKFKMDANLRTKINYNSSQSILVSLNGRAKLCSKRLSDKLKEENIKVKLEEIYRNVENFEGVEIVKIENFK
ncbi:hypothetical protein BpHYR1_030441 [Brachionus plicatilis]|uniref:Reelin domain-containing protein n=1 Tax=Brachionus plicatilis TaxID=10195 RepID=A0A3M7QTU2_BRAPC|nr:hypothetical protein BpHYR1_030441 [Brachionus plicatilis]